MNKAIQRQGISVIFVHGVGSNADHIIKDLKGKILLETRNLDQVFKWVNQSQVKVVRVERDYEGRGQARSFLKGIENKGANRPIPINRTQQYAEHHEEAKRHKVLVSRVSSKFGVENEVAEKLLPFIDAILPDFRSRAASGGVNWNEIDWESLDEKAEEALKVLSEAEWF
jgi:hypothetical protein